MTYHQASVCEDGGGVDGQGGVRCLTSVSAGSTNGGGRSRRREGCASPGSSTRARSSCRGWGADEGPRQVANVAHLPGIVTASLAMPDMHWGYGFPIGGVAAFDLDEGIVSPGGVGYDINCGCRLMTTRLACRRYPRAHPGARHGALPEHPLRRRFPGTAEALRKGGTAGPGRKGRPGRSATATATAGRSGDDGGRRE